MKRFFRWLRGDEGWSTLALATLVALLPAIAFSDARWLNEGSEDLTKAALFGAWAGIILARSRLRAFLALPPGLVLGGAAVFLAVGRALPPIPALWARLGPFWDWLQMVLEAKPHGADPISPLFWETVRQSGFLVDRFAAWFNTVYAGGTSSDNLVFLLQVGVLAWVIAFLAGWGIYRWHEPFAATLPCGIFVLVNAFLAEQGWGYVTTYLLCLLVLAVTLNVFRMRRSWELRRLDYSDDLPFDVSFISALLAAALVLLALPLPGVSTNPVARAWWNTLSGPWSEVETSVSRMFSGINNPNQSLGAGSRSSLVLGGSFDPRTDAPIFMYVTTDEQVPDLREFREMGETPAAPTHYWRGATFDTYTGRSWVNSERTDLDRAAGQPVLPISPVGFVSITQYVEIVPARVDLIYAVNQPYTVSTAYRVQAEGAEDYSSLSFRDLSLESIRYSVRSLVPNLGEEDLRAAPTLYPTWVTRRYLTLPSSLPQRVIDLSKQLTASARTPYDKALAIQNYLRQLPYDPKILLPSGDFDAVDYFLFLQKGYCDYFGTTMAVLLRASGVPARVARGYLPGDYDWVAHRYVVRENRLHTWTEIYFPPYGWIEFEPTPGQPPITRPPGSLLAEPSPLPTPEPPAAPLVPDPWETLGMWGRALLLLAATGVLAVLVWALYPVWEQRLTPSQYAELIYQRMARYGAWAGRPRLPSESPADYAQALGRDLSVKHGGLRLGIWIASASEPSELDAERVQTIAEIYQQAAYGPRALGESDRERVRKCWQRVKGRLWSLALARERKPRHS